MTLCKHNINKKYCKACKKNYERKKKIATKVTEFLFLYAEKGIPSAIKLIEDIDTNKSIIDLEKRLGKVINEVKQRGEL